MKVIFGLPKTALSKNTCIAIGIFDGVHRGHQYLINKMIQKSRQLKAVSTVITFYPHPAHVLRPQTRLPYLASLEERLETLSKLGVEQVIVIKFDKRFASISPEYFIGQQLCGRLKAKAIFVGEDFRFGRDRSGDIFLFKQLSERYGYEFIGLSALMHQGSPISSTRVRGLITEGNLAQAKRLLGRDVSVTGKVIKGDGRGRTIGTPTANVAYESDIIPPKGVYAVRVQLDKKQYNAVANLGIRPSFPSAREGLHLEVHLLDRNINLYNKVLHVSFIRKIRDEKPFASIELLKAQIAKDILKARSILKK